MLNALQPDTAAHQLPKNGQPTSVLSASASARAAASGSWSFCRKFKVVRPGVPGIASYSGWQKSCTTLDG